MFSPSFMTVWQKLWIFYWYPIFERVHRLFFQSLSKIRFLVCRSANSSTQEVDFFKSNPIYCSRRGSCRRSGSYLDQASPGIRRLMDFSVKPSASLPMGSYNCTKRKYMIFVLLVLHKRNIYSVKSDMAQKFPFFSSRRG